MSEAYIPGARDTIVAYCGWTQRGDGRKVYRTHCAPCCAAHPLVGDDGMTPHKIYGDLHIATGDRGRADEGERCDMCNVALLELSRDAQAQHDEQQARWARLARPAFVIEMGMTSDIRCRVY